LEDETIRVIRWISGQKGVVMKSDLWIVFAVTAAFLGFMMGYGVPPMQEVGVAAVGGHGAAVVEQSDEANEAISQFKDLEKLLE
jgi:hypothetical protein